MTSSHKPPRFTIEERILLHLVDFIKYRKEIVVPESITQHGISQAIGIQRKHIPRSLKSLMEKGLLLERTTHVVGKPQRMKTYFLTFKGEQQARTFKNHVTNLSIKIRDSTGHISEVKIGQICKLVKRSFSYAEILTHLSLGGIFDVEKIYEVKKDTTQPDKIDSLTIYKKALEQAWKDGKMTKDEKQILHNLRKSLHITEKNHMQLEEEFFNSLENTSDNKAVEVYKVALEQALEDGKISEDEKKILEKIKKRFQLKDI